MKTLLPIFVLVALAQIPAPSPAHPFPSHETPPANWFCYPANANHDPAVDVHACVCLGMQEKPDPEKLCQTEPEPCDPNNDDGCVAPRDPQDNAKCKAYCHKSACTCDTQCETS